MEYCDTQLGTAAACLRENESWNRPCCITIGRRERIFLCNDLSHKLTQAIRWMKSVRSWDLYSNRSCLPGPPIIHIQTTDLCNGACIMCPYSSLDTTGRGDLIGEELYRKKTGNVPHVRLWGDAASNRVICGSQESREEDSPNWTLQIREAIPG